VSGLAALFTAIDAGGTLAWLLAHAPDGDADRAVREAWHAETNDDALSRAAALAWRARGLTAGLWSAVVRVDTGPHHCAGRPDPVECPQCCTAIRAVVGCPTWAELTAS